ncbi:MAG TPA: hypothetical protein VFN49_12300 [Candidatus Aquilonibacter sp.]|nr:hypothetical protein [Candidatus Aquilonibacter sp.]
MYLLAVLIVWGLVMLLTRKSRPRRLDSDDGFIPAYLLMQQFQRHNDQSGTHLRH